jgi:hypothetical protein
MDEINCEKCDSTCKHIDFSLKPFFNENGDSSLLISFGQKIRFLANLSVTIKIDVLDFAHTKYNYSLFINDTDLTTLVAIFNFTENIVDKNANVTFDRGLVTNKNGDNLKLNSKIVTLKDFIPISNDTLQ